MVILLSFRGVDGLWLSVDGPEGNGEPFSRQKRQLLGNIEDHPSGDRQLSVKSDG
jgi:hypothetical protein